jgi:hypothetical protein
MFTIAQRSHRQCVAARGFRAWPRDADGSEGSHAMTPMLPTPPDLVAASLLTSATGAELHLVVRGGRRLRVATDEETGQLLAHALWRVLEGAG